MRIVLGLTAILVICLGQPAFSQANGMEAHPTWKVLAQDRGHVAIINAKGDVEWEAPCKDTSHDIAILPNGNYLLHTSDTTIVEMTPDKKVVWKHVSTKMPGSKGVQIHAFQRLADGNTMVAEAGNCRIIEVDKDDKIVKQFKMHVEHPSVHSDVRLARKLANGHYLMAHETDGAVREYDENGKVVWEYKIDLAGRPASPGHGPEGHGNSVYSAFRLPSGNTLIGGGNNNRVIEVDPAGKIVWSIDHDELPGITLAWVTMLEVLPNGNIIIGNCHAGPTNPQLIEVTRDKKVVWTFKDMKHFGNATAAHFTIGIEGDVIR